MKAEPINCHYFQVLELFYLCLLLKRIIVNSIKFIADSNLWIALATASFYGLSLVQLGQEVEHSVTLVFLFFSSLFIYTLFQLLDKKNAKPLFSKILVAISLVVIIVSIPFLSFTTLLVLMLSGLLTFFYATPLLSLGKNDFNLRKFWFLKSAIVALVWMLSCAVIPLLEFEATSNQLVLFSLEKFLFILGITIPYDIKDIENDSKQEGMTSIAMKFGIAKTKWISNTILFIGLIMALMLYPKFYLAILLTYSFALIINFKVTENATLYWYTILIDASIILYFVSFWISSVYLN